MEKFRLTTSDNPFDPYTQWDDWYFYDLSQGYNTCERLAMIAKISVQLPDEANESEIEEAAEQLMFEGAFNKQGKFVDYIKVINPNLKQEETNKAKEDENPA